MKKVMSIHQATSSRYYLEDKWVAHVTHLSNPNRLQVYFEDTSPLANSDRLEKMMELMKNENPFFNSGFDHTVFIVESIRSFTMIGYINLLDYRLNYDHPLALINVGDRSI